MRHLRPFNEAKKKKFEYEKEIIDPIVELMEELSQNVETAPQLAKIGYMYNHLWYAGRRAWGYDGLIQKGNDCENNPKYKIEDLNELAYDAWGMHVSNGLDTPSFKEMYDLVKVGKPITDFQKKERKPNKTMDEWVEVLTDPQFEYHSIYPDRKSVLNHVLCVIGNGYGINNDGYVIRQASGADQDQDTYGNWENAQFDPTTQRVVDRLLSMPELKKTLDTVHAWEDKMKIEKDKKEREQWSLLYKIAGFDHNDMSVTMDDVHRELNRQKKEKKGPGYDPDIDDDTKYRQYYPISTSSIIGEIFDEERPQKCEPNTMKACIEICEDIIAHEKEERKSNVKFAYQFLSWQGRDEYKKFLPKKVDKYALLEEIKLLFHDITDELVEVEPSEHNEMNGKNAWYISLNDSKRNKYAINDYFCVFTFKPSSAFPIGRSSNIGFLSGSPIHDDLSTALDRLVELKDIQSIIFHYDNTVRTGDDGTQYGNAPKIHISINPHADQKKHDADTINTENYLTSEGFMVGKTYMTLPLKKLGIMLETPKSRPLNSAHPSNKSGKEYFGNSKDFVVLDKSWKPIIKCTIDDRSFNNFSCNHIPKTESLKKLADWLIAEHALMKQSDKGYYGGGRDKQEGQKCLYAHDFMMWVRDHQDNFKKFKSVK